MNQILEKTLQIQPRLIKRAGQGWLAVSPENASIRIGVTGPSEDATRKEFFDRLEKWIEFVNQSIADR